MADVNFLFDNQLIAAVESLIKDSKNQLLLVSPFIDLDKRIQDALREKIVKHDFELLVLFGKNEDNYFKSIKKDSFEFFKQFPNVEIRYNERLHAKFYLNDYSYIMTSLNLYDYSLAKNIEVGIKGNYASKGLIGKVIDGTDTLINQGVDKVRKDVFGLGQEVNPIEKFETIFKDSTLLYKNEPIVIASNGLKGVLGGKKLNGYNVVIDNLSIVTKVNKSENLEQNIDIDKMHVSTESESLASHSKKTQSASQLSKQLGVSPSEITNLMQNSGLINGDKITSEGLSKGLVMKNYMGKEYISYPEDLPELKSLKV